MPFIACLHRCISYVLLCCQVNCRLVIAGNHDAACRDLGAERVRDILSNATYLQDEPCSLECGLFVYASPRSVRESARSTNTAFQPSLRTDIPAAAAEQIPDGIDLLVTHGPPAGVMDGGFGSETVMARVGVVCPTAHVFGHVHSQFGIQTKGPTTFANCASVDSLYAVTHPVVVLDIPAKAKKRRGQT